MTTFKIKSKSKASESSTLDLSSVDVLLETATGFWTACKQTCRWAVFETLHSCTEHLLLFLNIYIGVF